MSETTVQSAPKAAMLCPYTFGNGEAGFSVYAENGIRISKHKGDIEAEAKRSGLPISKFPPNPKTKAAAK